MSSDLHVAWTHALPRVLALLPGTRRDMFRQELQRFLAMGRFQPAAAESLAEAIRELLLTSLRAAQVPAALNLTRETPASALAPLCEHLLAGWRDAESAASAPACDTTGTDGAIFFGPRLGGAGRPGALQRDEG